MPPRRKAAAAPEPAEPTTLSPAGRSLSDVADAVEQTPAPALVDEKGWSTLLGSPYSLRRKLTAYSVAFVVSIILRQAAFASLPHLRHTLAPVERDHVEWSIVALVRAIDLAIALFVWWESGRAVDPPALGLLLTLISRPPLYSFVTHYFLVSAKTAYEVLLTDLVSYLGAAWVIGKLAPRKPAFRRQPIAFLRSLDADSVQAVTLAVVFGTLVSALTLFLTDRLGLKEIIRQGTVERVVPAFLAPSKYGFAFASRHPSLPVPVFRSDLGALSMLQSVLYSVPLAASLTAFAVFVLPQAQVSTLSTLAFVLTAPQTALYLNNVLPFKLSAAVATGLEVGGRAALVAAVTAWTLVDVRQPNVVRVRTEDFDVVAYEEPVVVDPVDIEPSAAKIESYADAVKKSP